MTPPKPKFVRNLPAVLKSSFRAAFFSTCWYSDDHDELDRIFRSLEDPWNFRSSSYERERFSVLLDEVRKRPHGSILEVGCAEGHFTGMLAGLTPDVTAIDVSPTAIGRARERHPGPDFIVSSLEDFRPASRFDLAVCAETLYYISDVPSAIERLSAVGRWCLVSYLRRESGRLDRYFRGKPGVEFREIRVGRGFSSGTLIMAAWQTPDGP